MYEHQAIRTDVARIVVYVSPVNTPHGEPGSRAIPARRTGPFGRATRVLLLGLVVLVFGAIALWGPSLASHWQCRATDAAAIIPKDGALFGVNLDWASETVAQYSQDLGHSPAVAAQFTNLPYDNAAWGWVTASAAQAKSAGAVLLLTLEPNQGLDAVTARVVTQLASDLRVINDQGTPVVLRFAHEMNGSWYPWSQRPTQYIEVFRKVAAAVHQRAPGTAMLWAPNYGGGYPFSAGQYGAVPGTSDFALLDTNADGVLTMADDPYLPYYPGDDAVDWVGMSLYHWGKHYPWGTNDIPEAGKLAGMLTGTYSGSVGDERAVPDFYQVFGAQHRRPVAITETAALYAPGGTGADELAVKQAWWRQVFSNQIHEQFPMLKMINWFEWNKDETEVGGVVDWRTLNNATTRTAFVADLPSWLTYGGKSLKACTWGFN